MGMRLKLSSALLMYVLVKVYDYSKIAKIGALTQRVKKKSESDKRGGG